MVFEQAEGRAAIQMKRILRNCKSEVGVVCLCVYITVHCVSVSEALKSKLLKVCVHVRSTVLVVLWSCEGRKQNSDLNAHTYTLNLSTSHTYLHCSGALEHARWSA